MFSSTYEAWWDDFAPSVPLLPETTAEMGETWLTGYASDPYKMAYYRAAAREYAACVGSGACAPATDPRVYNFARMLMKLPEHTWGLPSI